MDDETLARQIQAAFAGYRFERLLVAPAAEPHRRPMPARRVLMGVAAAALALAALLVGPRWLAPGSERGPGVAFASWTAVPTQPDPLLASEADAACLTPLALDVDEKPGFSRADEFRLLLQDQRGAAAAFEYVHELDWVFCVVYRQDGDIVASTGSAGRLEPSNAPLTVDSVGTGSGEGASTVLLGRSPRASTVEVQLGDGTTIQASVAEGRYLAWWPGTRDVERVVARDRAGAELARIEGDAIP